MPRLLVETEIKAHFDHIVTRSTKLKLGSESRSPGVHISGIIRHCMGYTKTDSEEMPWNMALGLAWEAWAVGLFPEIMWQPGQEELDGIYATPDGLSSMEIEGEVQAVVEEFKLTWKSIRNYGDILKQTAWIWQVAALCHMQGLRHARLHIMFVNGDYHPPHPIYMTYLIEFTAKELEGFWRNVMLKNQAKATPEVGS